MISGQSKVTTLTQLHANKLFRSCDISGKNWRYNRTDYCHDPSLLSLDISTKNFNNNHSIKKAVFRLIYRVFMILTSRRENRQR